MSATDHANNQAEETFAEALKLDNEDPSADSFEEITGWNNGEIEGNVYGPKDDHSGLAAVGMKIDGKVVAEVTDGLDVDGVVMDVTVEAGEHTLVYFVRDNVGHEIESDEYHFSTDTDKPVLEFTSVPSTYTEGITSLTIEGHVEDADSGLNPDSLLVSRDGGKTFEALEIDDNGDFVITFNPEQTKQVTVRAADMVGNESEITSRPVSRLSGASSRMNIPAVVLPNMLIKPTIIDKDGSLINDFSGVASARAFVYGRGFDHAEIKMSKDNNYAFMWDGKFPYNGDFIDAPEGWYWLTVEVTDNADRVDAYSYRVWVGPVEKKEKPAAPEAPAYTTFDISGLAGNIDNTSITVNGTRYLFADFSKIDTSITNGSNVTGRARAYKSEIEYHAKRMSQAVLFLFLVLGVGMVMHMNFFTVAVLATAAAIGGFILPDQKINSAIKKRKETIEREMGFGLERISLSLTSGTNLTTALSNAKGVGTFGNICETLASCINTNQNINEVIKVIKDDLPNMSLMNEFLELVRQSIIKGQDIAKAFQTTAEILRDRLELEIIDAGGKAKIKITLLTSTFLVASSLIVAIGPIAITIMNLM